MRCLPGDGTVKILMAHNFYRQRGGESAAFEAERRMLENAGHSVVSYTRESREIDDYNAEPGRDPGIDADVRRLTNVGTLRAYILAYLRAHPKIHEGMTLLVRQLQPGPEGLPIEIYCFTNDTDWGAYEGIQSDLFDHILAIVHEFGLRVFQNPTGASLEALAASRGAEASHA